MAVNGPPVSLLQAAQEFNCSPVLTTVRTAAGLPAAGGLLELAGMSSMQSYHDVPIFTFGADIDIEAYWVFYMNNPSASGIGGSNGYVGPQEFSYDANIVTPQLYNKLSSYPYLQFSLEQYDGSWRASGTITEKPNAGNGWNIIRVTQADWASGAGWSRYRILLYADKVAKPLYWSISPLQSEYCFDNDVTITPSGGHPPYLIERVIDNYPSGGTTNSGWTTSPWHVNFSLDYNEQVYTGHFRITDQVGQTITHPYTYRDEFC